MRIVYNITVVTDAPFTSDPPILLDDDLAADLEDAVVAYLFDSGTRFAITTTVKVAP